MSKLHDSNNLITGCLFGDLSLLVYALVFSKSRESVFNLMKFTAGISTPCELRLMIWMITPCN